MLWHLRWSKLRLIHYSRLLKATRLRHVTDNWLGLVTILEIILEIRPLLHWRRHVLSRHLLPWIAYILMLTSRLRRVRVWLCHLIVWLRHLHVWLWQLNRSLCFCLLCLVCQLRNTISLLLFLFYRTIILDSHAKLTIVFALKPAVVPAVNSFLLDQLRNLQISLADDITSILKCNHHHTHTI
jgi:hypothetical protein